MNDIQPIPKIIFKSIAYLLSLLLFVLTNYSQETLPSKWRNQPMSWAIALSEDDRLKMEKTWQEVGEYLKNDKNPFAGTYGKTGYGSGYFLRWTVEKGFILISYFDENMIGYFSYGKAQITKDNEIILTPQEETKNGSWGLKETPRIWIPVANGEYIVPKDQMTSFGDFYGGFGEFNGFPRKRTCDECGTFAKRLDNKNANSAISLTAPPKYVKFIKKPLSGKIVRIGKRWRTKNTIASCCGIPSNASAVAISINIGKQQGVTKNILFLLIDSGDNFNQILKITKINNNTSEGIVFRALDENGNENYDGDIYDQKTQSYNKIPFPPLRVGTKVTTSPIFAYFQ